MYLVFIFLLRNTFCFQSLAVKKHHYLKFETVNPACAEPEQSGYDLYNDITAGECMWEGWSASSPFILHFLLRKYRSMSKLNKGFEII